MISKKGEFKFFDTQDGLSTISVLGAIQTSRNLIPQGTGESERIGRKATLVSLHYRYSFRLPAVAGAATQPDETMRIIIYIDKQTNGGNATVTDLLETANIRSFRNLSNTGRFSILMDKMHSLKHSGLGGPDPTAVQNGGTFNFTWSKKCELPLEFSSTMGALAELKTNNVGVLLISDRGVGQFLGNFRVRYSD